MPSGKTLDEVISEAEKIIRIWEANPTFSLGEITLADLKARVEALREERAQLEEARAKVARLVISTNSMGDAISAITTRARSGIRAVFGPDSSEYEESGGRRSSDRKVSKKKKS